MTSKLEKLLLRPTEVADALSICRSKAYTMIASGEIPSMRIGKSVRVPVSMLRAWLKAKESGAKPETSIEYIFTE